MAKVGRKPKTQTRLSLSERLRQLYPNAIEVVEDQMQGKDESRLKHDNAWNIIHQIDGKPRQRVQLGGDPENKEPIKISQVEYK